MRRALCLALGLLFGSLGVASAAPAGLAEHLKTAYAAFQAGRYPQAIAAFRKAYALEADPRFLLNIAISQSRMRACGAALQTFERAFETCAEGCPLRAAIHEEQIKTRRACLAKVRVETRPAGASVRLGATEKTTPETFEVPAGTHQLRITHPGWVTVEEELQIAWQADTRMLVSLLPSPDRRGELTVRGLPQATRVELNGKSLGETPLALAPGPYTLAVQVDDDPPKPLPILVRPGGRTEIDLAAALIEPPTDYRTEAWTALGVGAAGLLTGIVFHARLADHLETERTAIGRARVEAAQEAAVQDAILAQVGYGVAIVGLGSAITFWVLSDEAPE